MKQRFRIRHYPYGRRIEEMVSQSGSYIVWDGLFQSEASAVSHIEKTLRIKLELSLDGINFVVTKPPKPQVKGLGPRLRALR